MNIARIPFTEIPQLAKTDVAYATAHKDLKPFYKYSVELSSFQSIIEDRKQRSTDRVLLQNVLKKQYQNLSQSALTTKQIEQIGAENTFSVVTAHQPSLFLGPLYFVYKICSTIRLSQELRKAYPDCHFVPIFVIGGEDHDFDEVNHLNLYGKKITWQNEEKGAVGMMKTDSLSDVLEELKSILGDSEAAQQCFDLIEKTYTSHDLYHHATQAFIHEIFAKHGLLVLNTNDADLKRAFIPYIKKEILEQPSQQLVAETQQQLNELGYKAQAFPREINLFYLKEQLRERIVFENNQYKVLNTTIEFSESEIINEVENYPERFSPNVVLRPLYQEVILPNLAYIGGGGEIAYWLERKKQFAHFDVSFPMLIRRNSVMLIDEATQKRMDKLELKPIDIFQDIEVLIKTYVTKNASGDLNFNQEKVDFQGIFKRIESIAKRVDISLEKVVIGEGIKQLQALEQLESRIVRAEKQKHETELNQIRTLIQKLCPNNGLQERFENFLPYHIKYGQPFYDKLLDVCNPIETGFIILNL